MLKSLVSKFSVLKSLLSRVSKIRLSKIHLTGTRLNVLTVVFVSLTGMVCLLYAVVFLNPRVLPMSLQVPTKTSTQNSSAAQAVQATRPFPTFPAEWTAAYATRRAQIVTPTPTPLGASDQGVSPALSPAVAVTANLPSDTPPIPPALLLTPTATLPSPIAPGATMTATETGTTPLAPSATPLPTASQEGYPTGYPVEFPTWTPLPSDYPVEFPTFTPLPPDYPSNP